MSNTQANIFPSIESQHFLRWGKKKKADYSHVLRDQLGVHWRRDNYFGQEGGGDTLGLADRQSLVAYQ